MIVRRYPTIVTFTGGTVSITAVGLFGWGYRGWGIYPAIETLGLVVGSIARKPSVVDGRIEPHEILHLTVMLDHNVIDGAPATRFARSLIELIECGSGLVENQATATNDLESTGVRTEQVLKLNKRRSWIYQVRASLVIS
jgi:hypothetical protein